MRVEVDQSNKVEQTERDTVLALSNDVKFTILLHRKDKRLLQQLFKRTGRQRFFSYYVFAALLALLLKDSEVSGKVVVDREYASYEGLISERTQLYLKLMGVVMRPKIQFLSVGKLSPAHELAAQVSVHGKKPNRVAKLEEVLKLVFNIKKDQDLDSQT